MTDCIPGAVCDGFDDVVFFNLPLLYCEYKGGNFFCIAGDLDVQWVSPPLHVGPAAHLPGQCFFHPA